MLFLHLYGIEEMITDIIQKETLASTNDYAREYSAHIMPDSGHLTVITARQQTKGRGQQGNSWESEDGKNLLFSILCHPLYIKAHEQYVISAAIALAVSASVKESLGAPYSDCISIKWPNDIYYNEKKMGGILIENDLSGSSIQNCIIGVGIDVNQTVFTSNAPNPVSMANIGGKEYSCTDLLNKIITQFNTFLEMLETDSENAKEQIFADYMKILFRNDGSLHRFKDAGGEFTARISSVDRTGRITLTDSNGSPRRYEFKELTFIFQQ